MAWINSWGKTSSLIPLEASLPTPTIMTDTKDAAQRIVVTGSSVMSPTWVGIDEIWQNQLSRNANFQNIDSDSYTLLMSMRDALMLEWRKIKTGLLQNSHSQEAADTVIEEMLANKRYLPVWIRWAVSQNGEQVSDAQLVDMIKTELDSIDLPDTEKLQQDVWKWKFDPSMLQSLYMSLMAGKQAWIIDETWLNASNPTINLWHGFAGVRNIENTGVFKGLIQGDPLAMWPTYLVSALPNMPAPFVANVLGSKNLTTTDDNACASGLYAINSAIEKILSGRTDIALAGWLDAVWDSLFALTSFGRMWALARWYEDNPLFASRPFSDPLEGGKKWFVLGDGGALFTLESLAHANARNAEPLSEIIWVGLSTCNPLKNSLGLSSGTVEGQVMCMEQALAQSGITAEEFKAWGWVVITHGTATWPWDTAESQSVHQVFWDDVQAIAPKDILWHALGGAGPQAMALGIKMMQEKTIPWAAHYNDSNKMDNLPDGFNLTPETTKQNIKYVLVNAFWFGGHNASVLLENPNY